jgi:two-component system OmpR family sensor kinase
MSSSPRSDQRRRGLLGRLAALSLRTRLIAAMLALMAAICAMVSGLTAIALREFLVDQLDHQLSAVASRPPRPGGQPLPGDEGGPEFLLAPGLPAGTLSAHIDNGSIEDPAVLGPDFTRHRLAPSQVTVLTSVPPDGRRYTRDLGELGHYRVVAAVEPNGDIQVTGLPLSGVQNTVWRLIAIEVTVAATALLVIGVAGAAMIRLSLRPLRRVAATASRVAELPLSRGEVALSVRVPDTDTDPRTEVGQVGAALNRLLGHVADALAVRHASETRARQFVADASHELRTPLAAIRGYAELTRRGHEDVPPDVAHALRRVESESARMTVLVEDLLLLARLDSGRPLDRAPVDLSRLCVDTVSDAHAAGPDHRWLLDLPEDVVTVTGDSARLHQALANLLANARTHTPPGTTVTTKLRVAPDGSATLSVLDNGPGVPPQLQPEVFERFSRGDTSRSRAAGSTGLGLSIVAAVVEAHGGTVSVASRPGHTEFVIALPGAEQAPEQPDTSVNP